MDNEKWRTGQMDNADVIQDDIAAILRALGYGDHARPMSCHRVVHEEIIPGINVLRRRLERAIDLAWEKNNP